LECNCGQQVIENKTEREFSQERNNNMNKENTKQAVKQEATDANRDPISGKRGSHPVGTGVGATGGAVAGAAIGAVGGPVGAAVGLATGAVVGGLTGKAVAEKLDPTVEDAYWRTNYSKQKYVEGNATFATYQPAYRTGYEGHNRYPGKKYQEVEADLQRDYERSAGTATLAWDKAKHATHDAWNRGEKAVHGHRG
jgi:uncharacterized protein YcfJ